MMYEEMWFTIRIRDIYTRSLVEPQISSPLTGILRPARPRTSTCIYSGCIMHVSLMHIFMMQVQCTLSISNHAYIFWPPGCVHDACIYDANIHGLDLWPWYVCMMHIYQCCGKFRHQPTEIEFLGYVVANEWGGWIRNYTALSQLSHKLSINEKPSEWITSWSSQGSESGGCDDSNLIKSEAANPWGSSLMVPWYRHWRNAKKWNREEKQNNATRWHLVYWL